MKVRLIMRKGIADANGRFAGWDYQIKVVDVVLESERPFDRPEIIGGEWLDDDEDAQ